MSRTLLLVLLLLPATLLAQQRPRGRDLGIPFPGRPGPLNAITAVSMGSPETGSWRCCESTAGCRR
jgi:hypothetical protein